MDANGLTVVDSTDVLTANADIERGREVPKPEGVKRLPGHEHQAGADWDLYDLTFIALAAAGACLALLA